MQFLEIILYILSFNCKWYEQKMFWIIYKMLCVCHNQLSDLVNHWTSLQPDYRGLKYIHLNKGHTNIIWNMFFLSYRTLVTASCFSLLYWCISHIPERRILSFFFTQWNSLRKWLRLKIHGNSMLWKQNDMHKTLSKLRHETATISTNLKLE